MTQSPILTGCEVLAPLEQDASHLTKPDSRGGISRRDTTRTSARTRNRFIELNSFVDVTLRKLGGAVPKIWIILWRDTKPNGLAVTSQTDLAKRAGVSVRTVYSALKSLESMGLLIPVRKGRIGTGASAYRVSPLEKS
jgi:DNA-binding MarR family transcriptional regulator